MNNSNQLENNSQNFDNFISDSNNDSWILHNESFFKNEIESLEEKLFLLSKF